jgi:hypothetical protein
MYKNIKPYQKPRFGNKTKRAVAKFTLDGKFLATYPSIKDAAESLKRDGEAVGAGISHACRFHSQAYNRQWRYIDDCEAK